MTVEKMRKTADEAAKKETGSAANQISGKASCSSWMHKARSSGCPQVFLFHFLVALAAFAPLLIQNGGLFTLTNDYNEQQIPFAMLENTALKEGGWLWNWSIDLGSSFVGACSYYGLGSPFTWLSFLFPARYYLYLAGWLYMLKYAVAGTLAYVWLKRFTGKPYAVLGSALYAFSGFQCVNLIFQFHDAVAFFPLLLIGYEKLAREGKKGALAFGVFVNAFVNYYLFTQEVIFLILYFLFREGLHLWKKRRLIGRCFAEGFLGCLMAGVILIPSLALVLGNPRVSRKLAPENWFYSGNRDYLQVLRTLLFPGETMTSWSCIREYDWSSWSMYLPMVSLSLVLCYLIKKRKDWLSGMIAVCIVATGIPLFNSAFGLFADSNYHRWLFMPILLMSLASARVLEERKIYPIKTVCALLAAFMLLFVIGSYWWSSHRYELIYDEQVFLTWSAVGIGGVLLALLITAAVRKEKRFLWCMGLGIAAFGAFTTGLTARLYYAYSAYPSQNYYDKVTAVSELELPDERYRIHSSDNTILMTASLPGTGAFTSTVQGSLYAFYDSLGLERTVFTPDSEWPDGLRELLGGKYYITHAPDADAKVVQSVEGQLHTWYLCEYEDAVPIGTAYDSYMTCSDLESIPMEQRGLAMLEYLVVADEDAQKVDGILKRYEAETKDGQEGGFVPKEKGELLAARTASGSESLTKEWDGFTSVITSDGSKYAFFSVPYADGFRAYVNGEETEILQANGMMAVRLEDGKNEIRFVYRNDGLLAGAVCTVLGFGIWGWMRRKRKGIE